MLAEKGPAGQQNLSRGPALPPPQLTEGRPINFFSIESGDPRREFWVALARLIETLRPAAMGKAVKPR